MYANEGQPQAHLTVDDAVRGRVSDTNGAKKYLRPSTGTAVDPHAARKADRKIGRLNRVMKGLQWINWRRGDLSL